MPYIETTLIYWQAGKWIAAHPDGCQEELPHGIKNGKEARAYLVGRAEERRIGADEYKIEMA